MKDPAFKVKSPTIDPVVLTALIYP